MTKIIYILIVFCWCSNCLSAQIITNEKRIYIIDVTASMEGKGNVDTPDVFGEIKQNLIATVGQIQNQNTDITLITFSDKVHAIKNFSVRDTDSIINYISNLTIIKGDTNIVDAWKAGVGEIESDKINYLFLLTDGLHNTGPEKYMLYEVLKDWEVQAEEKYYFAFYVMLTEQAKTTDIANAIQESSQIWMIESLDVNVTLLSVKKNLKVNINSNKRCRIIFNNNRIKGIEETVNFKFKLEDNPFYRIKSFKNHLSKDSSIVFELEELKPLIEIPIEVNLQIELEREELNNPLLFFTPEKLNIKILNQGVRKMYFKVK